MVERNETVAYREEGYGRKRRISWGAIFAGLFIALGVQMLLGFLGAAIGLAAVNPANPGTLAIGAGIWLILSGIVSLFIGGWVAGRLSGEPARLDRGINGLVVWGLVTLVSLYLITTTAMSVISGAFSLIGSAFGAVGQAVAAVAPPVGQLVPEQFDDIDSILTQIRRQAEDLFQERGDTLLTAAEREQLQEDLQTIYSAFQQLIVQGNIPQQTRQQLQQIIAERTDLTEQEAEARLSDWIQQAKQARQQVMAYADSLQQAAESAADAVAGASAWIFFVLLLDAVAAAVGAIIAAPWRRE